MTHLFKYFCIILLLLSKVSHAQYYIAVDSTSEYIKVSYYPDDSTISISVNLENITNTDANSGVIGIPIRNISNVYINLPHATIYADGIFFYGNRDSREQLRPGEQGLIKLKIAMGGYRRYFNKYSHRRGIITSPESKGTNGLKVNVRSIIWEDDYCIPRNSLFINPYKAKNNISLGSISTIVYDSRESYYGTKNYGTDGINDAFPFVKVIRIVNYKEKNTVFKVREKYDAMGTLCFVYQSTEYDHPSILGSTNLLWHPPIKNQIIIEPGRSIYIGVAFEQEPAYTNFNWDVFEILMNKQPLDLKCLWDTHYKKE